MVRNPMQLKYMGAGLKVLVSENSTPGLHNLFANVILLTNKIALSRVAPSGE